MEREGFCRKKHRTIPWWTKRRFNGSLLQPGSKKGVTQTKNTTEKEEKEECKKGKGPAFELNGE